MKLANRMIFILNMVFWKMIILWSLNMNR